MTVKLWSSLDGDLGAAGSYTPSGVPSNGDTVLCIPGNAVAPATNMDALKAVDLELWRTCAGFTPNIGSEGNALEVSANKVVHEGSGCLHYKDGDGTTDELIIDSPNMLKAAALDGTAITMISAVRGAVLGLGSLGAVSVLRTGLNSRITWNEGAGAIALAICSGGIIRCSGVVTALVQGGGTWTQELEEIVTWYGASGKLVYNSPTATGTMTTAYHLSAAILDLLGNGHPKTITNYYGEPDAVRNYNADLHTFTNEYDMTGWRRDHGFTPYFQN